MNERLSLSYIAVSPTDGHMQLGLIAGAYSNAIVFVAACVPLGMLRVSLKYWASSHSQLLLKRCRRQSPPMVEYNPCLLS